MVKSRRVGGPGYAPHLAACKVLIGEAGGRQELERFILKWVILLSRD
jgi:hypothetical protein